VLPSDDASSLSAPLPEPEIRQLDPAGFEATAHMLARAFRDNPLNCAVIAGGEQRRYRSNLHGMRGLLAAGSGHAQVLVAMTGESPAPRAALVAMPPGDYPLPPAPIWLQLRSALGQGPRTLGRWGHVFNEFQQIHPVASHWYLGVLGVDPPSQRQGLGRALLAHWLSRVDVARLPSYLETDRKENVAFYAAAGFEVSRELSVFGVTVWCMWRQARASGASN
jgi:ribosomal protein S18 acetylase RimI-like enzyme